MSRPFCANEKCFLNGHQAEDHDTGVEIELPTGAVRHFKRGWLISKADDHRYPLCECCATVIEAMRSDGSNLNRNMAVPMAADVSSIRPFCAIPKCFLHDLDTPADQPYVDVGLPSGTTLRYKRDWLISRKEGVRFPLCESCGNVLAAMRGDGEGFEADAGMNLSGAKVGPDGEVVDEYVPEPGGDIPEPAIKR